MLEFFFYIFRCHGMTVPNTNVLNNGASIVFNSKPATCGVTGKGWDHRWLKHCPCGGQWKIEVLST